MDRTNRNFVLILRSSHQKNVKDSERKLSFSKHAEVVQYLRYHGKLRISDFEYDFYNNGPNNYVIIFLNDMVEIETCISLLKDPIEIYQSYFDNFGSIQFHVKMVYGIAEYKELFPERLSYPHKRIKTRTEPFIQMKFYSPKDIVYDKEELASLYDWIFDELKIKELEFSNIINFQKQDQYTEMTFPKRCRDQVLTFMTTPIKFLNKEFVFGKKPQIEITNEEIIEQYFVNFDWTQMINITLNDEKIKLYKDKYSSDDCDKIIEIIKSTYLEVIKNNLQSLALEELNSLLEKDEEKDYDEIDVNVEDEDISFYMKRILDNAEKRKLKHITTYNCFKEKIITLESDIKTLLTIRLKELNDKEPNMKDIIEEILADK